MSLPKKGTRSLVVDGEHYRWLIRRKPTYGQASGDLGMSVAVELDEPGATLLVQLDDRRPDAWVDAVPVSIQPSDVARYVRAGISRGWAPALAGQTFTLRSSEVA